MNSNKKHFWRKVLIVLLVFIVVIIAFIYTVYTIETDFKSAERDSIITVQDQIYNALYLKDDSAAKAELDKVVVEHPVDIIIRSTSDGSIFYKTVPIKDGRELSGHVNKDTILLEAGGTVSINSETYELWYCIYKTSTIYSIDSFFLRFIALVLIILLILIFLIIILQHILLKPLHNIKISVESWQKNEYSTSEIEHKDNISRELHRVFLKKEEAISNIHKENTKLELELGQEKERQKQTIKLSQALIHDLKAPIHATLIENELSLEEDCSNEEKRILGKTERQLEELIYGINSVLKVLREDANKTYKNTEEFDFVKCATSGLNHIRPIITKKT
ncbi:MAG: hypothetical protein ACK5LL_05275 [Suipraeoptans sp.]